MHSELQDQLALRSKKGLEQDIDEMQQMLEKIPDSGNPTHQYYKQVQEALKLELEQRNNKEKPQMPKMPKSALKRLCKLYAPQLKFSSEALTYLEQIVKIETSHIFKKLSILARQRNAKTIKTKDIQAIAEMQTYD